MTKLLALAITCILIFQTAIGARSRHENIFDKGSLTTSTIKKRDSIPASITADIEKKVQELMQRHDYPGISIGLVFEDNIIYSRSFGVADRETKKPVTVDTLYQIGSLTKVFTATLIVEMRDKGIIRLDDPISKYLPGNVVLPKDPRGRPIITLKHLLTHTSGLPPDVVNPGREKDGEPWLGYSLRSLYAGLAKTKLEFPTGARWGYSNLGFGLLGQALERATGKKYENLLKQNIFVPLKMNSSTITLDARSRQLLATPYRDDHPRVKTRPWDLGALSSAGGITSSVADLSKFMTFQFRAGEINITPVSGSSLLEMQTPQQFISEWRSANGLGWRIDRSDKVGNIVSHGGDVDGYASYFAFSPTHKIGVIVLTNCGIGQPIATFGGWLMGEAVQAVRPALSKSASLAEADAYHNRTDVKNAVWAYETITNQDSQNGYAFSRLGINLSKLQKYEEAVQAFQRAFDLKFRPPNTAYNLACVNSLKGDKEAAFQWLERAFELGFQSASALLTDPDLDNIRRDPRFKEFLQRYNKD
jgi:serine-type D-Ala-D-Ala carboxypeptidase/endopeptidase